jgi:TonB family protein
VLLTPVASYPSDVHAVKVDRSDLTPALVNAAAEGMVVLKLLVLADGTVGAVEIVRSSGHQALDAEAVRAGRGWRFEPATRDGRPIEAWVLIPVRFVVP